MVPKTSLANIAELMFRCGLFAKTSLAKIAELIFRCGLPAEVATRDSANASWHKRAPASHGAPSYVDVPPWPHGEGGGQRSQPATTVVFCESGLTVTRWQPNTDSNPHGWDTVERAALRPAAATNHT